MITTERESTIWVRWPIMLEWGSTGDITDVKVAAMDNPDDRPASSDLEDATIIDEEHELFRTEPEIGIIVGPANGERLADLEHDGTPQDKQLWVAIGTASEWVLERAGVWEIT